MLCNVCTVYICPQQCPHIDLTLTACPGKLKFYLQYIQHSEDTPFTMEMKRNWIQSRVLGTGVQYATAYLRYLLTKETKINLID